MSNVEFGIKLKYDGKEVDSGVSVSREQFNKLGLEANKAGRIATTDLNRMEMSAKATSAALRGVPAQFTDIITSLQGGQAPMTVLFQQGGQLKDMFGGTANAARALGGYVAGLVTPFTVATAVVAGFSIAAYKGAEESRALAKSLILSGNAAGQSVDSIYRLADGIEASIRTTKGAAAEAVSQAAATGKVSAANLRLVAEASISMQQATGTAVSETIEQFADLGKAPVQASQKLQAQYGYLTAEVYRQIKALEDQGKTLEAGELAQNAYAGALVERSGKIIDSLGLVEKTWMGLGNVAKKAWDEMLGLGRQDTLEEKLAAAIKLRDGYTEARGNGNMGDKTVPGNPAMQAEVDLLKQQIAARDTIAKQQKESVAAANAAVAWESEEAKYLDKKQQKLKEIERVTKLMTDAGKDQVYQAKVLAEIEKKYAEKKTPSTPQENKYKQLSEEMDKYLAQLNAEIEGEQKLTKGQSIAAEVRRTLTKAQQDARAPSLALIDAAEQTLELRKEQTKADEAAYKELQRRAADMATTAAATKKETESIREHTAELGLSAEQIDLVKAARFDDMITLQEHELAEIDATGTCTAYSEALRGNIDALKARRSALQEQSYRQAEVDAEKKIAEARKKGWEEADRAARDVFVSIADDGSDAMEKIGKTLKTALLSAAYEATLQPIVFSFYTSAIGALGGSTGTGGTGGVGGTLTSAGNLLSTGNSLYNVASGGGIAGGFLSGMASVGSEAALGAAFVGPSATLASGSVGLGANVGSLFGSAASGLATAIPIIGGVITVASLLGGLFESGERFDRTTASQTSIYKDGVYKDTGEADYNFADEPDFGSSVDKALARLNKQFATSISTLMESLGEDVDIETDARLRLRRTSGALATNFMASINGIDISQAAQYGKDGEDLSGSIEQFFNDVMSKGVVKAINATNIDEAIKELFAGLESVDSTSAMLTNVVNLATYSDELNDVWGISIEQAAEVATLTSESTDALIANVAAIAQFSAAQRSAGETLSLTRTDLLSAFDALSDADFPTTLADYDAAMKAVDTTVEGSIETFAELFALRASFAQYQAAIDSVKSATNSAVFDLRTDAEKLRLRNADLASIAAAAGVSIPQSAADLVALADAIDYTSESGINLALALPALISAFTATEAAARQVADVAAESADTAAESARTAAATAQAAQDSAREAAESTLTTALNAASTAADAAFDAVSRSIAAERAALDAAYSAQAASLNDAAQAARSVRDNISTLASSLTRALSNTVIDSSEFDLQRRIAAQSALDGALSAAQSGGALIQFSDQISGAITDLSRPSSNLYESFTDYARAQGRAAGTLTRLQDHAKSQTSVADMTLDAINASISAAEAQYQQESAALDETLELAQSQLDALNGINSGVMSVSAAMAALSGAVASSSALQAAAKTPDTTSTVSGQVAMVSKNGAVISGDTIYATNGYVGSVSEAKGIIKEAFGQMSPAAFRARAIEVGLSAAMLDEMYDMDSGTLNAWATSNGLQGFAAGGSASRGMYIAGENGPELITSDAATRIYPAEQTSALIQRLNSPANNTAELVREIRELRKVVEKQAEQLASIRANTGQTAEILDSNTGGGGPSLVRMV